MVIPMSDRVEVDFMKASKCYWILWEGGEGVSCVLVGRWITKGTGHDFSLESCLIRWRFDETDHSSLTHRSGTSNLFVCLAQRIHLIRQADLI